MLPLARLGKALAPPRSRARFESANEARNLLENQSSSESTRHVIAGDPGAVEGRQFIPAQIRLRASFKAVCDEPVRNMPSSDGLGAALHTRAGFV